MTDSSELREFLDRHDFDTTYGFTWDGIEVTRMCVLPNGAHVLQVSTGNGKPLEIYISPKGKAIRVFRGKWELR